MRALLLRRRKSPSKPKAFSALACQEPLNAITKSWGKEKYGAENFI